LGRESRFLAAVPPGEEDSGQVRFFPEENTQFTPFASFLPGDKIKIIAERR
jgi:hypothetical protein